MPSIARRHKSDQMMDVARLYVESGGSEPIDLDLVSDFAIDGGHWDRKNINDLMRQLCKRDFSRAFREQHHRDAQGRDVRTLHAKVEKTGETQTTLWGDIRKEPPEFMEVAFKQRRSQIVGDCAQLKTDVDSWNDNNTFDGNYQLMLDFADDVAEREQPTKYRPTNPK